MYIGELSRHFSRPNTLNRGGVGLGTAPATLLGVEHIRAVLVLLDDLEELLRAHVDHAVSILATVCEVDSHVRVLLNAVLVNNIELQVLVLTSKSGKSVLEEIPVMKDKCNSKSTNT